MATLTIRNLPDDVVTRLKEAAERKQRSMEQEVRELLSQRYQKRSELASSIRGRWSRHPSPTAEQVEEWIRKGRE